MHRELVESLLPEPTQDTEDAPHSRRRKRNSDSDDNGSSSSSTKKEAKERSRPLLVYQKPRPVATKYFFAPLRSVPMDGAQSGEGPSTEDNTGKGRPPPIILTSEVNLLSLQKEMKVVVTGEFFFWNTASSIRITTKNMADYKATQNLLNQKGLSFFTFYTKGDNPVNAVIRHLPSNTSSEDITVALQELAYEVISVKQMAAKRPFPTGHTLISLFLFLVTLARNHKSQEIFKITNLCNIIVKVQAYKSKSGLTQRYNCQRFGHIWVHCRQPPRGLWCGGGHRHRECLEKENTKSIPRCCNCELKDGESPHPTNYRGCSYAKEELWRRKNQCVTNQGSSGRTFFSKYATAKRTFASVLHSSVEAKQPSVQQKASNSPQNQQFTNKASGQSVQTKMVNSNATDMFVAFTMVQQIMTGLSRAASE
ncbi:hypothetical protein B7P43_G12787, partial [Cryptotermes secundus]